ncbi:hypothetical protein G6F51_014232 [Rhizopus arrhizus]|uniref:Uncharacterized protein n=1 Tax=Rhizopus oryzae TaxID=64495 RepID=A0A9P6XMZ2_RHIOR|nr:hypothetical protein G6F51_014232 [Rhizopus arrhizus]
MAARIRQRRRRPRDAEVGQQGVQAMPRVRLKQQQGLAARGRPVAQRLRVIVAKWRARSGRPDARAGRPRVRQAAGIHAAGGKPQGFHRRRGLPGRPATSSCPAWLRGAPA